MLNAIEAPPVKQPIQSAQVPAPNKLIVQIPDPDVAVNEESKMPVLEISDNDIVSILGECQAQAMALTQQVSTGVNGQQLYFTKQVVQQKKTKEFHPEYQYSTIALSQAT